MSKWEGAKAFIRVTFGLSLGWLILLFAILVLQWLRTWAW